MTLNIAFRTYRNWEAITPDPEPTYRAQVFTGANGVPIHGIVAIPPHPKATFVGTYGITGTLANQWYLKLLGRKAYAQGYAVVLFDWRAHGKTADLSPALTSDGLYEGEDFVRIASQAKALGCPAPFWFTAYSLGGQLALWGIKAAQTLSDWGTDLDLTPEDIGGGAVICPNLDANRSLSYLVKQPLGQYLEKAIARNLKALAQRIHQIHPDSIDPEAIQRVHSIWSFDHELVIRGLGFPTVEAYYAASSPMAILPQLQKPTLILYAADDPMFDPALIPDLQVVCAESPALDLCLTNYGGHVGYLSSPACQEQFQDPDPWWAWNRVLDWCSASNSRSVLPELNSFSSN